MAGVIGGVIALLLWAYVAKRASFAGPPGRLQHGWFLKGFGWAVALGACGLVYVMLFTNHGGQYGALSVLIVAFAAGAGYLLLESYGTSGDYDAAGITLRSAWTGRKYQRWEDLVSVTFRPQLGWHTLVFRDGTAIRLSNVIHGHGAALREAERSLAQSHIPAPRAR